MCRITKMRAVVKTSRSVGGGVQQIYYLQITVQSVRFDAFVVVCVRGTVFGMWCYVMW
jgi:hypothetical protein